MWEVSNRVGIVLSTIVGIALIAQAIYVVRIATWLAFLCSIWSVLTAPAIRFDIHWRSVLIYTINFVLSILCILELTQKNEMLSTTFCIGYGVVELVISIITAALYYLLPLPGRSMLHGKYKKIGTTSFNVEVDIDDVKSITIQCWFPLENSTVVNTNSAALLWTSGHPDHQIQESFDMIKTLASNNKLPLFSMKHLLMARTNSHWQDSFNNLALKSEANDNDTNSNNTKYPIAIYSHGLWGWRQIHHSACENLASSGYLVFACDHTPDSMCSRPLRGLAQSFAFPTPPNLPPEVERKFFQGGMERRIQQLTHIITHIQTKEFLNSHNLMNKLDFNNIHLWGHSYGGGTISALSCRNNSSFHIRSAVMLDGWIYPVPDADRKKGFRNTTALLNLSAELWPFGKYQFPFRADLVAHTKHSVVSSISNSDSSSTTTDNTSTGTSTSTSSLNEPLDLVIRGSDHQNFVDIYLIACKALLSRPSMLGPTLDAARTIRTIDEILPAYFEGIAACQDRIRKEKKEDRERNEDEKTANTVHLEEVDPVTTPTTTTTPSTAPIHTAVQTLLDICSYTTPITASTTKQHRLSPNTMEFIRNNVAHVSQLPDGYADYKAYQRVQDHISKPTSTCIEN